MEGIGEEVWLGLLSIILFVVSVIIFCRRSTSAEQLFPENNRAVLNTDNCPICIATTSQAVHTNCGHQFCGQCMVSYWNFSNRLKTVACPVCRQIITSIIPCRNVQEEHSLNLLETISAYNVLFSGARQPVMSYIRDAPILLRHLFYSFFSYNGLQILFRLRILLYVILGGLYLLLPHDLIPETMFGVLGFIDDIVILAFIAISVSIMYREYLANHHS